MVLVWISLGSTPLDKATSTHIFEMTPSLNWLPVEKLCICPPPLRAPPTNAKNTNIVRDIEDKTESFEGKLEEWNRMGRAGKHYDLASKEVSGMVE